MPLDVQLGGVVCRSKRSDPGPILRAGVVSGHSCDGRSAGERRSPGLGTLTAPPSSLANGSPVRHWGYARRETTPPKRVRDTGAKRNYGWELLPALTQRPRLGMAGRREAAEGDRAGDATLILQLRNRGGCPSPGRRRKAGANPHPQNGLRPCRGGTTRRLPGSDLGRPIRGMQRTWGVRAALKAIGDSPQPAELRIPVSPLEVIGAAPRPPPLAPTRREPVPGPPWRLGAVRGLPWRSCTILQHRPGTAARSSLACSGCSRRCESRRYVRRRDDAHRDRRTQNSLPSGSAMTTQETSR